jgi:hypothetical protein
MLVFEVTLSALYFLIRWIDSTNDAFVFYGYDIMGPPVLYIIINMFPIYQIINDKCSTLISHLIT